MGPKDAIRTAIETSDFVITSYLQDLSDADLLTRPAPNANHTAWQLGHLINSEVGMLQMVPGASKVELPPNWDKQHSKETSAMDPPKGFRTKAEYLELYKKVRENTLKVLAALPDADLDKRTEGPMAKFFPTIGSLFVVIADHPLMHAGQIAVLRRKLGKPIVM
jgi:hypothetical protein